MSLAPARRLALSALGEVRRRSGWVRPILDAALDDSISEQDAALARTLAIGTTQMRGSLDHAIDHWASRPSSIEPRVRDALRMSAYEILFLRTPAQVAVDQGVQAVRRSTPRAAGLANAVLRRISENADAFPWDVHDEPQRTALLTGHPEWLVQQLSQDLSPEVARHVLDADNTPPPLYLNTNLAITDDEALEYALTAVDAQPAAYGPPGCFRIDRPGRALASELVSQHHAIVSDAAAQAVAQLCLDPDAPDITEIGAGRGTKTLLLLSHAKRLGLDVRLTCTDHDSRKLAELEARVSSAGFASPRTIAWDAAAPATADSLQPADCVLLDAPCSGVGTLRRHPEKRWDLTPDVVESLTLLQSSMLANAASLVRPGGFVVYSTCTLLAAENDGVVDGFLGSELGSLFSDALLPDNVPQVFQKSITERGRLQTLPTEGGPDGHYAAVLRRQT